MSQQTVIEQEPETVAAQLPADTPAPPIGADHTAEDRSLDDLLAEYESVVNKPAEPESEATASPDAPLSNQELDKWLADLSGPSDEQKRIGELEGQIGSLRQAELDRVARADFEGWAKKLQSDLGPNVDSSFARTNLLAMATERPELQVAWQYRHITNEQIAAADREFRQLEALYGQVQRSPDNDPRKPTALAQLEARGQQLGYMLNARTMLDRAWKDVVKAARKVAPPIDELATADRDAVAFAVREAQSGDVPELPVRWGSLSAREGREKVLKEFGFDPGWTH